MFGDVNDCSTVSSRIAFDDTRTMSALTSKPIPHVCATSTALSLFASPHHASLKVRRIECCEAFVQRNDLCVLKERARDEERLFRRGESASRRRRSSQRPEACGRSGRRGRGRADGFVFFPCRTGGGTGGPQEVEGEGRRRRGCRGTAGGGGAAAPVRFAKVCRSTPFSGARRRSGGGGR